MDDLVEQVVMKVGGCRETQKLHGERGDEAQRDSSCTQDDEHWQVVRVVLESHTKKKTHHEKNKRCFHSSGEVITTSSTYLGLAGSICRLRGVPTVSGPGSVRRVHSGSHALIGFGGGPDSQPVVDGNDDGVLEKFRGHHQEDHEEATRGQVTPAHLRDKSEGDSIFMFHKLFVMLVIF